MKYSDKLKDPRWQRTRLKVLEKAKWACRLCCDTETTLHVHHNYYESGVDPWEYPITCFTCLCEHCHVEVEGMKIVVEDFDISNLKVYKSNNWDNGTRVMILSYSGKKHIIIYSKSGSRIIGLNLGWEAANFSKALK